MATQGPSRTVTFLDGQMAVQGTDLNQGGRTIQLPDGISAREALVLLTALSRVKKRGFGRLALTVGDGRVIDVEIIEKIHRDVLKSF